MTRIRKDRTDTRAFTLIEVIVSVVIIGVLASLALRSHHKAVELLAEQEAANQLKLIASALKSYKTASGDYPSAMYSVNKINSKLDLNIQNTDYLTFSCPNEYMDSDCRVDSSYGWAIHIENDFGDFCPHCTSDWEGGPDCPSYSGESCAK